MKYWVAMSLLGALNAQAYRKSWMIPGTTFVNEVEVPKEYLSKVARDPQASQQLEQCIDKQVDEFKKLKFQLLNPVGLGGDVSTLGLQKVVYRAAPEGPPSMELNKGGEAIIRFALNPRCWVNDQRVIIQHIKTKADKVRKAMERELPESADESDPASPFGDHQS